MGPQLLNQCVFIRGFRAKRLFFYTSLRAAAEPLPDDPDNHREDEIQVIRVPDAPSVRGMSEIIWGGHDVSLLVLRPAHRGFGLYRGGWSA
jgi:hypothetical protein